jgi:hypothetical protein
MKEQPFLYSVDERTIWGLDIKIIEASSFKTFIRVYSLFRSESLSANIKLALYKGLFVSRMTYAHPWHIVCGRCALYVDTYRWKLSKRHMGLAFELLYVTKLCRQQAKKVIQKHAYVGNIGYKIM